MLDTLAVNQPMAMRELARAAGVPAGSIHYVVHRLEDAGRVACVDGRWTLPKPAATPSKADPQPERPSSNGGVAAGPMRRDGFDPEAARLRAAEGI